MIAYFEEEAVKSYTDYLEMVESGEVENISAPQIAIDYYKMRKSAKLSDLIVKVREDEKSHSIINHKYADLNTNEPIVENNPQIKESLLNNYKLEKFSEGIIRIEKN